jgi:hypothetical protein
MGGTYSIGAKKMKIEINEEIFKIIEDSYGTEHANEVLRACNSHYESLDALAMALPYVETALEDQGYKPGAVDRMCKQIRQAIENASK